MSSTKNTTKIWPLLLIAPLIAVAFFALRPRQEEAPHPPPKPTVRQIELADTFKTNGLIHAAGVDTPFTGQVVEYYRDGKLKSQTDVRDGLLDGVSLGYFTNGTLQIEEPFHAGKAHGKRT